MAAAIGESWMGGASQRSAEVSAFEVARRWSTCLLIGALLQAASRFNTMALTANRQGRHSGWAGSAARALTRVSAHLCEAEIIRRKRI
jgi:hypothetical protein